jgi:hypothetical protein
MSYAAEKLARAVEVYRLAEAIECDVGTVEYLRGRALMWACIIIAPGCGK